MPVLFNKILIALPSEERAAATLAQVGLTIAQTHHAETRLVSVLSADFSPTPIGVGTAAFEAIPTAQPLVSEEAQRNRAEMINNIIARHTPRDAATHVIRIGNPAHEIVDEADTWSADMIIVGSRDRNWLERLFDPSVSLNVTKLADCAVLVLPEQMAGHARA